MKEQHSNSGAQEEQQYLTQKESIRIGLNEELSKLFDEINVERHAHADLVMDEQSNPIQKDFDAIKSDKNILEEYLPENTCDILFENNPDLNFSVSISKKKHRGEEEFTLSIMSNPDNNFLHEDGFKSTRNILKQSKESKIEEAQAICNPTTNLEKSFVTITRRGTSEEATRLEFKNPNQEKYACLELIEAARELARMNGLII
jgi:hypothetical protein